LVDGREPFIIQGQSAGAEPGNLHTSNFVTVAMQTTGSLKAETRVASIDKAALLDL
jgi:hypothetical protein